MLASRISDGDRASILEWIAGKKRQGTFTVIDAGGSASAWTKGVADAYADIHSPPPDAKATFFRVDLNTPDTWTAALDHVARHGKYDFSVCAHTLEDLSNPKSAVDFLQRVSKAGFIAVPSKYRELARFEHATMPWRGYIHHKWIFDARDGRLVAYPKQSMLEYHPVADALASARDDVRDLSLVWSGSVPYVEVNDGYLGPTSAHVIDYYNALLDDAK